MRKSIVILGGATALLCASASVQAQPCVGDCSGDRAVAIDELIKGVNIALGSAQIVTCAAFDKNDDTQVAISELIESVTNALSGMCPGTPGECGNGTRLGDEECDDGNNFGADGCAANCTNETARAGVFDVMRTTATVQTEAIPIPLVLTGSWTFRTGKRLAVDRPLADGTVSRAGEIPAAVRADEIIFPPVMVPGLVCACVRGIPFETFGPGNASSGSIACGESGIQAANYRLVQDHNTSPGDPNNRSQGAPDDPECDDVTALPGGSTSTACLEGTGDKCNEPEDQHIGVCRSPRILTRSGGDAGRGSAFLPFNVSISLLRDAGTCSTAGKPANRPCPYPQYGADCQPCTPDDTVFTEAENIPLTTGISEAAVYDANNNGSDAVNAVIIAAEESCFGSPCLSTNIGSNFDCELLDANPTGGLSGGSLAVTFPGIDSATIGDNTTGTVFFNQ